jgi:hypothetical protein
VLGARQALRLRRRPGAGIEGTRRAQQALPGVDGAGGGIVRAGGAGVRKTCNAVLPGRTGLPRGRCGVRGAQHTISTYPATGGVGEAGGVAVAAGGAGVGPAVPGAVVSRVTQPAADTAAHRSLREIAHTCTLRGRRPRWAVHGVVAARDSSRGPCRAVPSRSACAALGHI